jgi:6-phosphofructokinase 1
VTCGGLCPGLNDVIRALVMELWMHYDVRDIVGFRFGYRGLVASLDTTSFGSTLCGSKA